MKKSIILVLAAAMLGSCGTLKHYKRPADITTDGIYSDAQRGDGEGLGDLKWREIFTDPTLQALIEKALEQNTDIKNTGLQLQEMQYALKASKFAFLPTFSISGQGSLSKLYDSYNRPAYEAMTQDYSRTYGFGLTAGWMNANFLQLINQKRGAQVNIEQLKNAQQAVQAALVSAVASMYYNLSQLDEQLQLARQTESNWAQYLAQERKLMDAGQANLAAVANIEATYYSICQSVVTIESNIKILENNLCTLLGETRSHINRGALSTFRSPAIVETGAPVSILARRPDVKSAELNLCSRFYKVSEARSAFYPSLTLSATGQFTNSAGAAIINPGLFITNFLAGLSQPIFMNGRLRATLEVQKREYEIAKNNFQQAIIAAGNEVNTAMLEIHNAGQQKALIDKQVSSLETAYDATKKMYELSSVNYLNVITAHNSLLSARMSQIRNRMEAISATIELYQALGGGTE